MIPNGKYRDTIISLHMTELVHRQAHFKIYTKALVVFFSHEESANICLTELITHPVNIISHYFLLTVIQINALTEHVCRQSCIQEHKSSEQLNMKRQCRRKSVL